MIVFSLFKTLKVSEVAVCLFCFYLFFEVVLAFVIVFVTVCFSDIDLRQSIMS